MARIVVDYSRLEAAASAVDAYVETMKRKMAESESAVEGLAASWHGDDAAQFMAKWGTVSGGGSTYSNMVKSLESYAKFLRYAAAQYKNAQRRAVERASGLPR